MINELNDDKIDLGHATYYTEESILSNDLHVSIVWSALVQEFPNENEIRTAEPRQLNEWSWSDVENSVDSWDKDSLLIIESEGGIKNDIQYAKSQTILDKLTPEDLNWDNFQTHRPLLLFDSDYAGLHLPKYDSYVSELNKYSTIVAPTAIPSRDFVKAFICNLGKYGTIGKTYRNARNNYYWQSPLPSGLSLMSYELFGSPLNNIQIPNIVQSEFCDSLSHDYDVFSAQSYQILETGNVYTTYTIEINETIDDYDIIDEDNFSLLTIPDFIQEQTFEILVLPVKVNQIKLPLKTIIVNLTILELSNPLDITIDDLPEWDGKLVEKACSEDTKKAGISYSHSFTETSEIVLTTISPVEIINCTTGEIRLFTNMRYKIEYIPFSPIIINKVEYNEKAAPEQEVIINVSTTNIQTQSVIGKLKLWQSDVIIAEKEIDTSNSLHNLSFIAPEEAGLYTYKLEFYFENESRTYAGFNLDVGYIDSSLIIPSDYNKNITLLLNNRFNYETNISINYFLEKDDIIESGIIKKNIPSGESITNIRFNNLKKEDRYYNLIIDLIYKDIKETLTGIITTNHVPSIKPIPMIEVGEEEMIIINVSAYDIDNDQLTLSINDSRFTEEDNIFTWQTEKGDEGEYIFEIDADDGLLESLEYAHIIINNSNKLPIITPIQDFIINETDKIEITVEAYDPEGMDISFSMNGSKFSQNNNTFTWQTKVGDGGSCNLQRYDYTTSYANPGYGLASLPTKSSAGRSYYSIADYQAMSSCVMSGYEDCSENYYDYYYRNVVAKAYSRMGFNSVEKDSKIKNGYIIGEAKISYNCEFGDEFSYIIGDTMWNECGTTGCSGTKISKKGTITLAKAPAEFVPSVYTYCFDEGIGSSDSYWASAWSWTGWQIDQWNVKVVRCYDNSDCGSGKICDKSGTWDEWVCIQDPCNVVKCNDYCDSDTRYYSGRCSNGKCSYQDQDCEFGCNHTTKQCNGDPCDGVICENYCESDIRYHSGMCSEGECTYEEESCEFGCNSSILECKPDPCDEIICQESFCEGHIKYFSPKCELGECLYLSELNSEECGFDSCSKTYNFGVNVSDGEDSSLEDFAVIINKKDDNEEDTLILTPSSPTEEKNITAMWNGGNTLSYEWYVNNDLVKSGDDDRIVYYSRQRPTSLNNFNNIYKENLTFEKAGSYTKYIKLKKTDNITSAEMEIEGFRLRDWSYYGQQAYYLDYMLDLQSGGAETSIASDGADDRFVYVSSDSYPGWNDADRGITKINKSSGEVVWRKIFSDSMWNIEQIDVEKDYLIACYDEKLVGINATDGEIMWEQPTRCIFKRTFIPEDSIVYTYIVKENWNLNISKLNITNGEVVWSAFLSDSIYSGYEASLSMNDNMLFSSGFYDLYGLNKSNGDKIWYVNLSTDLAGQLNRYPSLADNNYVWVSNAKKTMVYNATDGEKIRADSYTALYGRLGCSSDWGTGWYDCPYMVDTSSLYYKNDGTLKLWRLSSIILDGNKQIAMNGGYYSVEENKEKLNAPDVLYGIKDIEDPNNYYNHTFVKISKPMPNDIEIKVDGISAYKEYLQVDEARTIRWNYSSMQDFLVNCIPDQWDYCTIPIEISSSSGGILEYSNINIEYKTVTNSYYRTILEPEYFKAGDNITLKIIRSNGDITSEPITVDAIPKIYSINHRSTDDEIEIGILEGEEEEIEIDSNMIDLIDGEIVIDNDIISFKDNKLLINASVIQIECNETDIDIQTLGLINPIGQKPDTLSNVYVPLDYIIPEFSGYQILGDRNCWYPDTDWCVGYEYGYYGCQAEVELGVSWLKGDERSCNIDNSWSKCYVGQVGTQLNGKADNFYMIKNIGEWDEVLQNVDCNQDDGKCTLRSGLKAQKVNRGYIILNNAPS
ncbi:MAG: PQQ-binding-like beta-propeller repeat protein, partial [Nanoarchaeota archaeon]